MDGSRLDRYGPALAVIAAALLPFKLTLGYIGLIPLILLWLSENIFSLKEKLFQSAPELKVFALFACVAIITSIFGINPSRSLMHSGTLFFFPLTIVVMRDLAEKHGRTIMSVLLCGQAIACMSALLENAFPTYNTRFLGPVSQSGQISLTLFLGLGLYFSCHATSTDVLRNLKVRHLVVGIATAVAATLLGFSRSLGLDGYQVGLITILFGACIFFALQEIRSQTRDIHPLHSSLLATILLPIIIATLLVNLKRGPWMGIFIGVLVFSFLHAKRLLIPLIAGTMLAVILINPVQSRLLASEAHFYITGGRNAIWQIGGELALKYPLGIGFENSGFLQKFSSEIPSNLKHFHNNFLNITVETGWLGLFLYVYAFYLIIRRAFCPIKNYHQKILASAIGCALIAWQAAGLVEYNFGDSAVVNIAYILIGILIGSNAEKCREEKEMQKAA